MALNPYRFQLNDVKRIRKNKSRGSLDASVTGSGKSLVGVLALLTDPKARVRLIIAPVNTLDGWTATLKAVTGESLALVGGVSAGLDAQWNQRRLEEHEPGWYFVGWEYALRLNFDNAGIDGVILDELHRASNRKSSSAAMTYKLGKLVHSRGGIIHGASATPFGNRMEGAWAVGRALWPNDKRFTGAKTDGGVPSFWRWVENNLKTTTIPIYNPVTQREEEVVQTGKEIKRGHIVKQMPLYIRHEERVQCCKFHPGGVQADLPPRVIHRVTVKLTATQRKIYAQLEKDMFAWIEDNDYPIDTQGYPMVLALRLHQVCLAVPSVDLIKHLRPKLLSRKQLIKVSYPLDTKSSKIDALLDILKDLDEPVIVFTHSRGIIPAIVHRINAAHPEQPGSLAGSGYVYAAGWHGGVGKQKRNEVLKPAFIAGKIRVLVCQIGAIAEGVDGLQNVCHSEIWLSMTDNGLQNTQALGRLMRRGQDKIINSWQIAAEDTVETAQFARLTRNSTEMAESLKRKGKK